MRFGIEVPQDAPFPALIKRWQRAEALGLDPLWVADHWADTRTDHLERISKQLLEAFRQTSK